MCRKLKESKDVKCKSRFVWEWGWVCKIVFTTIITIYLLKDIWKVYLVAKLGMNWRFVASGISEKLIFFF